VEEPLVRLAIAAPLGLVFGSFVSVLVHRIPAGESVVRPRSRCPSCGVQIRARDNVPVVSWLVLRGRCRSCGARISVLYPSLELATGALFVAAALRAPSPWAAAVLAPFLSILLALSVIDVQTRRLPNRIVYPSLAVAAVTLVLVRIMGASVDLRGAALGALGYGGFLLVFALAVPSGMGMGDVKLAALIGLVLGSFGLRFVAVAAGVGIPLGGVGAIGALLLGASRKRTLPFGPYLAAGALVAGVAGAQLADLYVKTFLR